MIVRVWASRAASGSSIRSTSGSLARRAGDAHALLHAAGELVRIGVGEPGEPDQRQDLAGMRLRARARGTPRFSGPNTTLSSTVRQGRSACSWKTMAVSGVPGRSARIATSPADWRTRPGADAEAAWTCRSRSGPPGTGTPRRDVQRDPIEGQDGAAVPAEGDADLAELNLGSPTPAGTVRYYPTPPGRNRSACALPRRRLANVGTPRSSPAISLPWPAMSLSKGATRLARAGARRPMVDPVLHSGAMLRCPPTRP